MVPIHGNGDFLLCGSPRISATTPDGGARPILCSMAGAKLGYRANGGAMLILHSMAGAKFEYHVRWLARCLNIAPMAGAKLGYRANGWCKAWESRPMVV